MQSFGELLDHYAKRTGVSDTELARTLGVSRQTIFRWREGKTSRPRYRGDVVKVAEKLRLTHAETNTLLLAAGFPPDVLPETTPSAEPAQAAQPTNKPAPIPTQKKQRWLLLTFIGLLTIGALLLAALGIGWWSRPSRVTSAATAVVTVPSGTSAIAIAPCQLSPDAPALQPDLVTALEREIRNQRIANISVVALEDEVTAKTLNAAYALTLYCDFSRRPATVRIGHATLTTQVDVIDRYDLLAPTVGLPLTYGSESLNPQALAWVLLGQQAFNTAAYDDGFAYFTNAIALLENPAADYRAQLQAVQCTGRAVLHQPATAIAHCEAALAFNPDWGQLHLSSAVANTLVGNTVATKQALESYQQWLVDNGLETEDVEGWLMEPSTLVETEKINMLRNQFLNLQNN